MDYVDRLFAWFRHLIVKCEKQKHRLLIFFCDYTFNYKNNKKNIRTQLLKILKFYCFHELPECRRKLSAGNTNLRFSY